MHRLTLDRKELWILEQATRRVADELIKKSGVKLNYLVGTMIELPRTVLRNRRSCGILLLWQRSHPNDDGSSRDDAGCFLPDYVDEKKASVFSAHPFQSLETKGVGMLRRWGIEQGRKTRPRLKVGICGEHGGGADSVKFCHTLGMDCVSASPFRVPIARLAAAQVMVEVKQTKQKTREMTEKSDLK